MINGDDLRAMRVNVGISQDAMAKKLKCDRKTIINYELDVSDIPAQKLFRWLQCCKLDFSVLLGEIKAIRETAQSNGKAKLLDFITLAFILSQFWDSTIVTSWYLLLLGLCTAYGTCTKNINMAHIAGLIFITTASSYIIFETGLINKATPEDNKLLQSILIYGTQILFTLTTAITLIFRVQLSRRITDSRQVELTHYDGIFHWIFIYMAVINTLVLLEDIAYILFDMKSWTLIYDNFEGLIYIAWALCCGAVLTMMICTSKGDNTSEVNSL